MPTKHQKSEWENGPPFSILSCDMLCGQPFRRVKTFAANWPADSFPLTSFILFYFLLSHWRRRCRRRRRLISCEPISLPKRMKSLRPRYPCLFYRLNDRGRSIRFRPSRAQHSFAFIAQQALISQSAMNAIRYRSPSQQQRSSVRCTPRLLTIQKNSIKSEMDWRKCVI